MGFYRATNHTCLRHSEEEKLYNLRLSLRCTTLRVSLLLIPKINRTHHGSRPPKKLLSRLRCLIKTLNLLGVDETFWITDIFFPRNRIYGWRPRASFSARVEFVSGFCKTTNENNVAWMQWNLEIAAKIKRDRSQIDIQFICVALTLSSFF